MATPGPAYSIAGFVAAVQHGAAASRSNEIDSINMFRSIYSDTLFYLKAWIFLGHDAFAAKAWNHSIGRARLARTE
jgi:hypothetical protein